MQFLKKKKNFEKSQDNFETERYVVSVVQIILDGTVSCVILHISIEDVTQTYNFQTQCSCCIQCTEHTGNIESCTSQ